MSALDPNLSPAEFRAAFKGLPAAEQLDVLRRAYPRFTPEEKAEADRLMAEPADRVKFSRIPLYPKQAAIIDDARRFTITEASTKSGKTMSHIEWLFELGIRAGSGNWWWVATTSDVADIAFRRGQDRLRGFIESGGERRKVCEPIPFQDNLTRKVIRCGGAVFWFKSADEPDSLYGEDVRGAVGDEVTRWKEAAWIALYTTLTATKGPCKLIGNVKGRKNFAFQLARKAENGEPGWGYHKLTANDAIDGGVMSQEVLEQAKRDMPDAAYKELFLAEAADDQSNPFGMNAIAACVLPAVATERGDAPAASVAPSAVWGWDLARKVDWTVGIGLDVDGVVSEMHRFQRPWPETIQAIRQATGSVDALLDSTGVGDPALQDLQKTAHNFSGYLFSAKSKQQLMERLAIAIQRQEVRFPDGPIRSELEAFEYEYTRTGVAYSAPSGMHDDCVCALALAVWHRTSARAPGDYGISFV